MLDLKNHIRAIPDFPKPGVLFYDISTLLAHGAAWRQAITHLAAAIKPFRPEAIVGIDARGFLVAAPLAVALGLGFVMIRKAGKLPGQVIGYDYALEYGTNRIEIQHDAITPGQRVVVVDDLLATGGTVQAAVTLLKHIGAEVVHAGFLIELNFLEGRDKIGVSATSLVQYDQ